MIPVYRSHAGKSSDGCNVIVQAGTESFSTMTWIFLTRFYIGLPMGAGGSKDYADSKTLILGLEVFIEQKIRRDSPGLNKAFIK
jgi:hypothetical protein